MGFEKIKEQGRACCVQVGLLFAYLFRLLLFRTVDFLHVRLLDESQKEDLHRVRNKRYDEERMGSCDQTQAIVGEVPNGVHGVGEQLKDAVEDEIGLEPKPKVSPIPGVVSDAIMSVPFRSHGEEAYDSPKHETENMPDRDVLRGGYLQKLPSKDAVRLTVVGEYQRGDQPKHHPGLELSIKFHTLLASFLELSGDACGCNFAEQSVPFWPQAV